MDQMTNIFGDRDELFGWKLNSNGTISSWGNGNLVLGYGIATDDNHWKDRTEDYGWYMWKKIEGF